MLMSMRTLKETEIIHKYSQIYVSLTMISKINLPELVFHRQKRYQTKSHDYIPVEVFREFHFVHSGSFRDLVYRAED